MCFNTSRGNSEEAQQSDKEYRIFFHDGEILDVSDYQQIKAYFENLETGAGEKFEEYNQKAKELGFIINMDLIIGLTEESTEDIVQTLKTLKKYKPLTVQKYRSVFAKK